MKKLILSIAIVAMSYSVAHAVHFTLGHSGLIAQYDFEDGISASGSFVGTAANSADGTVVVDQTGINGDLTFESSDNGTENHIVDLTGTSENIRPDGFPAGNVYHGTGQQGPNGFAVGGNGTLVSGIPESFSITAWYKGRFEDRDPVNDDNSTGTGEQFFTLGSLSVTIGTEGTGSTPGPTSETRATGLVFTHRFRDDDVPGVPDADGEERDDWNPQPKGNDGTIGYADDVWHLVVMTYDGDANSPTAGLISLYVDNKLRGTAQKNLALHTTSQGLAPNGGTRIKIGGPGDGRNVAGYLDDLRIYNRVLVFVPEPTSIAIAAIGLVGFAGFRIRRRG